MSTWSLLDGYGIIKPDILTFGSNVMGLSHKDTELGASSCAMLSGTSISCSIVSASVALALSQIEDRQVRAHI